MQAQMSPVTFSFRRVGLLEPKDVCTLCAWPIVWPFFSLVLGISLALLHIAELVIAVRICACNFQVQQNLLQRQRDRSLSRLAREVYLVRRSLGGFAFLSVVRYLQFGRRLVDRWGGGRESSERGSMSNLAQQELQTNPGCGMSGSRNLKDFFCLSGSMISC